jgi:hypothetical protein
LKNERVNHCLTADDLPKVTDATLTIDGMAGLVQVPKMGKHLSHATQERFVMQREEMELLAVRATLWRMEIEILREIHRYRFAKRGRRFGSDVELMIVYGAAMLYYGFRTPVRALKISRYLEMPRETVRRHMGRLVALGLFERAEDQSFVPTKELRKVEIERALRLLRHGTAGLL